MSRLRDITPKLVLTLGMLLTLGSFGAAPVRAQYPIGPGFAYPGLGYGYGGYGVPAYGYGGYGYGYPGYGVGPGFPGFGVGAFGPGYGLGPVGIGYPTPFGGLGYGMPGYGPSGVGYANPLFSLGLSPLAVQNAAAERALLRGSTMTPRRVSQGAAPAPNPSNPANQESRQRTPDR